MPQISQASQIIKEYRTETVNGEVTVNINLNLVVKLDAEGGIQVSAAAPGKPVVKKADEEEFVHELPDFTISSEELIQFGKDID